MNWVPRIKNVLGKFWSELYAKTDDGMLDGVISSLSELYKVNEGLYKKFETSRLLQDTSPYGCSLKFPIYIECKYSFQAKSYSDILNNKAAIGDSDSSAGYVCRIKQNIIHPCRISNKAVGGDIILIEGYDYTYLDDHIVFHANPAGMGLPTVVLFDNGELKQYYRLFGTARDSVVVKDAVAAFEDPHLSAVSEYVWDARMHGVTIKGVIDLLCCVSGSVLATNDGLVTQAWTEQGFNYIIVNNKLYKGGKNSPCVVVGDKVKAGDPLFGSTRVWYDSLPPEDQISGIPVMTDAGELMAPNRELDVLIRDGVRILPLESMPGTTSDVVEQYISRCIELAATPGIPKYEIPDRVNPMVFVLDGLRKGRWMVVSMSAPDSAMFKPVMDFIGRCANASSVLTVCTEVTPTLATTRIKEIAGDVVNSISSDTDALSISDAEGEAKIVV